MKGFWKLLWLVWVPLYSGKLRRVVRVHTGRKMAVTKVTGRSDVGSRKMLDNL